MFRQENELIVGKLKTLKLEAELQHEKWIYSTDPPRAWSQTWSQRCVGRFVGTYLRSSNLAALEDADISIVNAIYYLI